jgi:hypothetical protein
MKVLSPQNNFPEAIWETGDEQIPKLRIHSNLYSSKYNLIPTATLF